MSSSTLSIRNVALHHVTSQPPPRDHQQNQATYPSPSQASIRCLLRFRFHLYHRHYSVFYSTSSRQLDRSRHRGPNALCERKQHQLRRLARHIIVRGQQHQWQSFKFVPYCVRPPGKHEKTKNDRRMCVSFFFRGVSVRSRQVSKRDKRKFECHSSVRLHRGGA